LKGSVYARNSIMVNNDAMVEGRTLSLKGDVSLGENVVLGPEQTGILQICKELDPPVGSTPASELAGRVFRFEVGSPNLVVEVVAGQCSGQIPVPSGPGLVITELLTGRTISGGTFTGGFQLIQVRPAAGTQFNGITAVNLPLRQATVTIRAGGADLQTRVEFVNRAAITAVVEICKEGLDTGVDQFYSFIIAELVGAGGFPISFQVPTGQCTGPITVQVPACTSCSPNTGTQPRTGVVTITEQTVANQILSTAFTLDSIGAPTNRFLSLDLGRRILRAIVAEGGIANQTTAVFVNRTLAQLKVCKIAGPGIPEFTPFTFAVSGLGPTLLAGNGPDPGTAVAGVVTVLAGTVTSPSCEIVPLTFLSDSLVTITELQAQVLLPGDPTQRETRVSRITSSSGITAPFTRAPNVPYFPPQTGAASTRTVVVPVNRETTEVEFVNIAFLPVPIKICKIGTTAAVIGQSFNFAAQTGFTVDDPNDFVPSFTSPAPLTITAGPAAQGGYCDFISGGNLPLTGAGTGSFNQFLPVRIAEVGPYPAGTTLISADATTQTCEVVTGVVVFFPAGCLVNGVNEVTFINGPSVVALPNKTKRFRMQF
jgi:hypothetical protein